jgi:hypothetical protein
VNSVLLVLSTPEGIFEYVLVPSGMYCDEPLLCNERFSADVIAMATNTENQPISRDGYAKYGYRDNNRNR